MDNSLGLALYLFDIKVIYPVIVVLCALMVSEIPMFAFKFKSYGWKGNEVAYLFT